MTPYTFSVKLGDRTGTWVSLGESVTEAMVSVMGLGLTILDWRHGA